MQNKYMITVVSVTATSFSLLKNLMFVIKKKLLNFSPTGISVVLTFTSDILLTHINYQLLDFVIYFVTAPKQINLELLE